MFNNIKFIGRVSFNAESNAEVQIQPVKRALQVVKKNIEVITS